MRALTDALTTHNSLYGTEAAKSFGLGQMTVLLCFLLCSKVAACQWEEIQDPEMVADPQPGQVVMCYYRMLLVIGRDGPVLEVVSLQTLPPALLGTVIPLLTMVSAVEAVWRVVP